MLRFFRKPYRWAICFTAVLIVFVAGSLLDTFVVARAEAQVNRASSASAVAQTADHSTQAAETSAQSGSTAGESQAGHAVVTDSSYEDDSIKITIETVHQYDTYYYVADIQIKDATLLKTALAHDVFGRNIKETTSAMASRNQAIFAINGDYYGFRNAGFVLRNGILYRSTSLASEQDQALAIDYSGNFTIIDESETESSQLAGAGFWQIFSFGPALVDDGQVVVTEASEVGQSMNSNPRTAIGQISPLHYVFIVSDGRSSESQGLSLLELASEFQKRGCTVAYNLDGGGSSTMWFNGRVINNPTDGRTDSERQVSDIVYIGYD
jgi:exopolysaccharide biosynthesis protein